MLRRGEGNGRKKKKKERRGNKRKRKCEKKWNAVSFFVLFNISTFCVSWRSARAEVVSPKQDFEARSLESGAEGFCSRGGVRCRGHTLHVRGSNPTEDSRGRFAASKIASSLCSPYPERCFEPRFYSGLSHPPLCVSDTKVYLLFFFFANKIHTQILEDRR